MSSQPPTEFSPIATSSSNVYNSTSENRFSYKTTGNLFVHRSTKEINGNQEFAALLKALDTKQGVLLASSFEFPGRYTRMDIGFCSPPLQISSQQREVEILAINSRGEVLVDVIESFLDAQQPNYIRRRTRKNSSIELAISTPPGDFLEEERTRIPSVFSLLRTLLHCFFHPQEPWLGFYGAFGYDLAFQCDPIEAKIERPQDHRDLVLYLPDTIIELDHARKSALKVQYEFEFNGRSTRDLERSTPDAPYLSAQNPRPQGCDHSDEEYQAVVQEALEYFARGDLFEAVPSRSFVTPCIDQPSRIFQRLRHNTPAPFGLFLNLGEEEFLVGASPEMYLRTQGRRIETCPIAGTIARGSSPAGDAEQIRRLLNSKKEEAELTMCTDVDRNDKSRVCVPGSVRVIGRRQIEMYSKLIHTVDHVEGILLDSCDSLDAFVSHMWAVTVTGAPKLAAMQFIEDHEKSHRSWYGGAVGKLGFDGSINTGLTLRTIRIHRGTAEVRAGATLLFDSDPQGEADETRLKASALLDALELKNPSHVSLTTSDNPCTGRHILLIDHRDSFVHTLANYIRQSGAKVNTIRSGFNRLRFDQIANNIDLVVLSPGPGRPEDFRCQQTIDWIIEKKIPLFGVCLGLQAIVEYFGGTLETLPIPVHGKPSMLSHGNMGIFSGMPNNLSVGRYHSLIASADHVPSTLRVTARAQDDNSIMGIEHKEFPIAAVQFHPESILSDHDKFGIELIRRAMNYLCALDYA